MTLPTRIRFCSKALSSPPTSRIFVTQRQKLDIYGAKPLHGSSTDGQENGSAASAAPVPYDTTTHQARAWDANLPVYDLPPEVLSSLTLKDASDTPEALHVDVSSTTPPSPSPSQSSELVGSQSCSLCSQTFSDVQEQRSHLKSDFHHYNLKQKLRGARSVSEVEFEKLIGDLDESLSGSDSSESDDEDDGRKETTLTALLKKQANLSDRAGPREESGDDDSRKNRNRGRPPLLWFSSPLLPQNTFFGMYRAVFTSEELQSEALIVDVIRKKQLEPISMPKPGKDGSLPPLAYKGPHIFLCMIGGGHFAAMVVSLAPRQTKSSAAGPLNREATVLAHKTFHRYTTRRKQGGSQSANDNAKGTAHSAGSSLRRYNEQALTDDVRGLLREWKGLLDTSDLLFIRATGVTNRRTLFGPYEGQVLRGNDPRVRGFPFSTRRATQKELMRSFIELTRLKVREISSVEEKSQEPPAQTIKTSSPKPLKPVLSEEEETALLNTTQVHALIRRSKLPALLSYLKTNNLSPDFALQPSEQHHHAPTPLHLAATQNSAPIVLGLISKGGADPTVRNKDGKTPFELAGDRATRDAFRVARSEVGEDKWDWEGAKIPPAMTKAEADHREDRERKESDRKETERRRMEEERLRSEAPSQDEARRKGVIATVQASKSAQEKREDETRGMTPEMKMRLERERRARAAEERIKRMQTGG